MVKLNARIKLKRKQKREKRKKRKIIKKENIIKKKKKENPIMILQKYRNTLLVLMCLTYMVPIIYVSYIYYKESSIDISSIITNDKYENTILTSMGIMGFFTVLYEIARNDIYSLISILALLFGIYGVILIPITNYIHYIFAFLVVISIMSFMIRHWFIHQSNLFLLLLVFLNYNSIFSFIYWECLGIDDYFFINEAFFIGIFAIFYLYLHFL